MTISVRFEAARVRTRVEIPCGAMAQTGEFITFADLGDQDEHVAIRLGPQSDEPLVRVHSECLTGDVFGSRRCDCGEQLQESIDLISRHGGYLLYLRQEGRGIGLYAKLDAYALQLAGADTFEANRALGFEDDLRTYEPAAAMLTALGIRRIKLLTNNPDKVRELCLHGIEVVEAQPTGVFCNVHNEAYLSAKAQARHTIDLRHLGGARPDQTTAPL